MLRITSPDADDAVNIKVVKDAGEDVLAICVHDLSSRLCKTAAKLSCAVSNVEERTVKLHDIGNYPLQERLEISQRRENLKSQTGGWWQFEIVETRTRRRLLISGRVA